ncbi:MAG: hypothetical protein C0168_04445 [Candidatus Aminicenantes bacterium]|nr:MAG: hypothetical protein C0168_04445 [Candidatus Aminicenantes bacterium]
MAISPVKRFEILLPKEELGSFLSYLQELGVAQIDSLPYENLSLKPVETDASEYDRWLSRIGHLLQNLPEDKPKKGLEKLLAQKPKYSASLREALLDFGYEKVVEDYERIEAQKNEVLQGIKQIEKEEEFLRPLSGLNIPLNELSGLEHCEIQMVEVQPQELEKVITARPELPWRASIISKQKSKIILMIIYHLSAREEVEEIFSEVKANFISLSGYISRAGQGEKVIDLLQQLEQKKAENFELLANLEKEMASFAIHRPALMAVYDVLLNEKEKIIQSGFTGLTERTSCLAGWIEASQAENFSREVHRFSEQIFLTLRDPLPEEMEQAPVILRNPEILKPFEVITSLYGLPSPQTIEPTVYLAPFFFMFVGLCVSEAGYGLVMALISFLYLKLANPRGGTKLFMQLLFYLGISNIIFGTLVGGWFGYPIKPLLLLDPIKDPIPFLILSLVLGFIQVLLSTFLSLVKEYRSGNKVGAIAVKGGWLLLLPSLVAYLALKKPIGILTLVGAAGVVFFTSSSRNPLARFFSGLYALYGISSYFADTLSYSRILALGLSTGVIAMVVNSLVQIAWKIPFVGWLAAVLIFVGGHLFNLAISFLGGFVHSMRLQFVEFFSRFYQAGGRPFKPFKLENKYVEFIR